MDAKITKSRLSNLLSYDWLKILMAAVVAVFAIVVFYTTIETSPKDEQTFTVYAYTDISAGSDAVDLADDLLDGGVFSYEILETQVESLTEASGSTLYSGLYTGALYTTRLANSARTVMFVSHLSDNTSDGYEAVSSLMDANLGYDEYEPNGFLDFSTYMEDCGEYLSPYFGGDLENGTLDEEMAKECFLNRNENDSRYRKEAKKEAGILEEYERFNKLRDDYLAVKAAFESETLSYSYITIEEDNEYEYTAGTFCCGVNLGKLNNLKNLYYYTAESEDGTELTTVSEMSLILFNTSALADKTNDLRYETVSFLSYLLTKYGA